MSWKGRTAKVLVVPVASKNTANGATPEVRDGITVSDTVEGNTVTVTVALALPPGPLQVRE